MAEQIRLPISVVGKPDIIRLQRELEAVENFMLQAQVRKSGESMSPPKTSTTLEALAQANGLSVLQGQDRTVLANGLKELLDNTPVMHISFASTPTQRFMEQLVAWFRQEVAPNILIEVGLQPSIAAGCTLRTTNKYFDFSLRRSLSAQHEVLAEKLRGNST